MNWKAFVIRHWKVVLLLTQIGIIALSLGIMKAHAEPIDTPCGP
jgi:hypothetical protein